MRPPSAGLLIVGLSPDAGTTPISYSANSNSSAYETAGQHIDAAMTALTISLIALPNVHFVMPSPPFSPNPYMFQ